MLTNRVFSRTVMIAVVACVCRVAPAEAQLNTQHIKGTVGLKSGSQAPPGVYFVAPIVFVYKADEVKGKNKVFAVGPEVQLALARRNTLYGFLKVNYQWEVYA